MWPKFYRIESKSKTDGMWHMFNPEFTRHGRNLQEREAVTQASALDVHGHIFFLNNKLKHFK